MGVLATLCAACGGPVNDDQYADPQRGAFELLPAHAWLRDVIGLPLLASDGPRVEGAVRDQVLYAHDRDVFVCDGIGAGDYLALHRRCWELAGCPETSAPFEGAEQTAGWRQIAAYHAQLFDFHACAAEASWLLDDPASEAGAENRARILAILTAEPAPAPAEDAVAALIASDRWAWTRTKTAHTGLRVGLQDCDPGHYEHWIEVEKPYLASADGLPQPFVRDYVTSFSTKLQRAVEAERLGVLLSIVHTQGSSRYSVYARDPTACEARIEGLAELHSPRPAALEHTHDPDWSGVR